MKTLTKGILGTVIAVACVYCGYATYDSYIYQQENALLLANVEALGQNESVIICHGRNLAAITLHEKRP